MKFTVNGDLLYQHVSMVSRIMASKNSLPILDCVLFNLRGMELELVASDSDNSMQTKMSVVESEGDLSIAMPARLVMDTFKNLAGKTVSISVNVDSQFVEITSGSYKSSFNGMDASAFPMPKQMAEDAQSFTVLPNHFSAAISNTVFAASTNVQRPIVMGLNMEVFGNSLRMTGTDSFKLSEITVPVVSSTGDTQVVLPAKGSSLLKALLSKEGEDVVVTFDSTNIMFALGDSVITVRQVEGKYPNVRNAIPTNISRSVVINRSDLIYAIRAISPFQDQATNLVTLGITAGDIHLVSRDTTQGLNSEDHISCSLDGDPFDIGFKSTFLTEILSNMDTQDIIMKVDVLTKGIVFEPIYQEAESKDEDAETPSTSTNYERLCLLMPINM
ncbi:MAG: DNA polymerase III subunit beta [Paludibacteraceae bacterium]|nr:DNA polymerase III subunit beta [Paludibacteraceae bacterium]